MSDMDDTAARVYRPLSSSAVGTRVVADAFALVIQPEEAYQESRVRLQEVEFAAFAVGGLAAGVRTAPTDDAVRTSATVDLPLADSAGGSTTATQRVTLYGPGDVRGVDYAQILRRYPAPGTLTAEETVLAHVEFDRPELPWQFSAAAVVPDGTMRPWLALIVVEKAKVHWEPAVAMLPILNVPLAELPNLARARCWAHAQAPVAANAPSLDVRLSPEYSDANLSRLLSPRILKQDTDYIAAVVPILDVGIQAGLGAPGGTLDWGWPKQDADPVRLPVYDSWEFRTGPDGDFRLLALRLTGVVPPYEVGRRFVDASQPGKPLESLAAGSEGTRQVLRCALFSPTSPSPEQAPIENAAWPAATIDALHQALDLPARIEGTQALTDGLPDLPIIGPRIYAAAHRGSATVDGEDWFAQLNLAPMHRIVAGLGTRVVQRDQEQLMQAAWAQLGEVEKANEAIRQAQLAELLAEKLHARLAALQPGRLLQVAAPVATRVMLNPRRTLAGDVAESATPPVALSGAFRRAVRPGGPVVRRAAAAARARAGLLVGDGAHLRDFTRLVANPDGIGRLDAQSIALFDVDMASQALGVPAQDVSSKLGAASVGMGGGLASFLTRPAAWGAASLTFDWAGQVARDWSERLQRVPADATVAAIREQRVAPLAAELATSKAVAGNAQREQFVKQAVTLNNDLVSRLPPVRVGGTLPGGPVVTAPGRLPRIELDRPLAGHAIGAAAVPRGGTSVRVPLTPVGRVNTQIPGISVIDPSRLIRLPTDATVESRNAALSALAGLAKRPISPVLDRVATVRPDDLRASLALMVDPAGVLSIAEVPRRAPASIGALADMLLPSRTVRAALAGRLVLSDAIRKRWSLESVLRPIMAAPRFDRPMYEALSDYDRDWLVPGLGMLPADDFVTVLETNPEFVESFLVGLSDEMGRELLWRGYPTDRRGTCFWRFWDRDQDELKQPIHRFSRTALKTHVALGGDGADASGAGPRAAIVIKSELVRRFPDLIIDVARNLGTEQGPEFERDDTPQQTARQLFAAHLEPDIAIIGIDLSIEELDKPEWWILVSEHPSALRFDRPGDAQVQGAAFLEPAPDDNGATFAAQRLHAPTRVAFRATDLIRRA